jgi:hypothetical protein
MRSGKNRSAGKPRGDGKETTESKNPHVTTTCRARGKMCRFRMSSGCEAELFLCGDRFLIRALDGGRDKSVKGAV